MPASQARLGVTHSSSGSLTDTHSQAELGNEGNRILRGLRSIQESSTPLVGFRSSTQPTRASKVGNDRGIGNHLHDEVFVNA